MSIVVFTGPSLSAGKARSLLDALYLPPVKYGDIYRAVNLFKPHAIGIIDGYFNQVPAVWHKEILWAMDQGILVFGAASMGALRAAELDSFGMQGVGEISTAYRNGVFPPFAQTFEDDDEVAVVHGPQELDFKAISEALVNIRATLALAAREGLISSDHRDRLIEQSKQRFYPQRSFEAVLEDAAQLGLPEESTTRLKSWIASNTINQKHRDSLLLLRELSKDSHRRPPKTGFRFENTSLWNKAISEWSRLPAVSSPVLDELRLLGRDYFDLRDAVLTDHFREQDASNSLTKQIEKNECWFQEPQRKQELIFYRETAPEAWLAEQLLHRLEISGDIDMLRTRAADKQQRLNGCMLDASEMSELDLLQLMDWYFSRQLEDELPDDLEAYAARLGGLHIDEFNELILREYRYLHPNL